ncbi:MAG: Ig-like domain-containing protein [Gemmatimonadaceae bacterium]
MRVRPRAGFTVGLIIAGSLLLRACESPTEPAAVASVTVTPSSVVLHPTQTRQLTATVLAADGDPLTGRTLTWTSSNEAAATVNGAGLVTALALGDATITATVEGISGTATVSVVAVPVASVLVTPATGNVIIGQTLQLTPTTRDSVGGTLTGRVVTWATSDATRATVSTTGLVTAIGLGPVTITGTSEGVGGTAQLTIVPVPVDSVGVSPATATRLVGQSVQFTATAYDSVGGVLAGRAVTWSSSTVAIATVDADGLVTAVAAGVATITATSEGVEGTAAITVNNVPVDSVEVQPDAAQRHPGQTAQFTATPYDSAGGALSGRTTAWTSSNVGVATVSESGLVTAVAPGTSTITATIEAVSDTAYIVVVAVPVDSVAVTPSAATRHPGQTVQLSAATLDSAGGTLTGRTVSWTSSNAGVATVDGSGLLRSSLKCNTERHAA